MFCTIYDTNHWSNKIPYMAKQFFNYIVNVLYSISWISSFHISKSSHQFKQRIWEGYGFPICLFVSWLLLGIDFYKEVMVYAQMSGNPKSFYFEEHTALNLRQCESRVAHNLHKSKYFKLWDQYIFSQKKSFTFKFIGKYQIFSKMVV